MIMKEATSIELVLRHDFPPEKNPIINDLRTKFNL
jgi:hypothetical protein